VILNGNWKEQALGFRHFWEWSLREGTKNINLSLVWWRSCMTATARDITFRIDAEALVYNIAANLLKRSNEGRNSGILVTIAVF